MNGYIYILAILVVILAIWVGHWFNWPSRLHPLLAYCYGVGTILAGIAIWMLPAGYAHLYLLILGIAAAAGIATTIAYLFDHAQKRLTETSAKARLYDKTKSE